MYGGLAIRFRGEPTMDDQLCTGDIPPGAAGTPAIAATLTQPQPTITLCTAIETIRPGTEPSLKEALAVARRDQNPHLVIDLSAITSLGSTEFFTLLAARHHHNLDDRGHLALVITPKSHGIPEVYVVALEVSFDLHHTLASAFHACTNPD